MNAIANRTLYEQLAIVEQQAREYQHCLDHHDAEGMLRASIRLRNAVAFLQQEAIDAEAAQRRQREVQP